jgi:hypothetical protein
VASGKVAPRLRFGTTPALRATPPDSGGEFFFLFNQHCPSVPAVDIVQYDFAAERISMQAENLRCGALIAFRLLQGQLYKFLFKLSDSFLEINSSFDHLGNQLVQLLSHESTF